MANKRIKISELPGIPYARTAGVNTPTVKNSDTVPITVSSTADETIKKTMSITTREMKRYVLQQLPSTTELVDESTGRDTTLTIAPGMTVRIDTLSADTIKYNTIESAGGTGTQEMANLTVTALTSTNAITVGNSKYPSTVYADDGSTPLTGALLVSNVDAKFTGKGMTLQTLIQGDTGRVTSDDNEGTIVSIDSNGRLAFGNSTSTLLRKNESFASSGGDDAGKLLKVSTGGGLAASTIDAADLVTSVNTTTAEFTAASSTDQKLLVYTSATPSLDDIKLASDAHMKLVTDVNRDDDADATSNEHIIADSDQKKVVVGSPLVLGYKHEDGVDLTEQSESMKVEAVVGEIRWNYFNGVPTIYLATKRDTTSSGTGVASHPCHWYGIPLFGTIDDSTLSDGLTAKEGTYSNDD